MYEDGRKLLLGMSYFRTHFILDDKERMDSLKSMQYPTKSGVLSI